LRSPWTKEDVENVIQYVYRQVLGNDYIMKSERLTSATALARWQNYGTRIRPVYL
jgi:phycocyanin-associated rod linker protein